MSAGAKRWWLSGLEVAILAMTLLALAAMARVRGVEWVVLPLMMCVWGAILYRLLRRFLFRGVEVLLVIAYFVAVKLLYDHLGVKAEIGSGLIRGLDVVGLVILYPAQVALWSGRRSLQELMLLALVAISQFLYGMTLSQPLDRHSAILAALFFPALIAALLHYAAAHEIEIANARPSRPRGRAAKVLGLAVLIVPLTLLLGAGVFYLLPRYSTLSRAVMNWGADPPSLDDAGVDGEPRGRTAKRTALTRRVDLRGGGGEIKRDRTAALFAQVALADPTRSIGPAAENGIHLRAAIFAEYDGVEWTADQSDAPRSFVADAKGNIALPGPERRAGWGTITRVWPLAGGARTQVVAFGRPTAVQGPRRLVGTPATRLEFRPMLDAGEPYIVVGERVLDWDRARPLIRRHRMQAVHPDQDRYTYVPDRPRADDVRQLAHRLTVGATTAVEKVDAILAHLEQLEYSLELAQPSEEDGANMTAFFLFDARRGHCELFSDALAVLLRHVGIPTRVVGGFAGGEWRVRRFGDERVRGFLFRKENAHSWTEVFFSGLGWVAIEPSPDSAPAVPGTPPLDAPDYSRERSLLEPDAFTADEQLTLYRSIADGIPGSPAWWIVGAFVGFLAIALLVRFARSRGVTFARRGPSEDAAAAAAGYRPVEALLDGLAKRGVPATPADTALEVARRAETVLDESVVPMVRRAYAAQFGNRPLTIVERDRFDGWLADLATARDRDG